MPLCTSRRELVHGLGTAGLLGVFAPAVITHPAAAQGQQDVGSAEGDRAEGGSGGQGVGVTPPEDLMREHGVLDRVLLIYEAVMRKISANEDFDPAVLTGSAEVVRDFIENYHEKLEENYVFPRFRSAGQMVELVDTLLVQHDAGRRLTAAILQLAVQRPADDDDRHRLTGTMEAFITMYRPHAAREDTDLFPKLRSIVSPNEFDALAEEFERQEQQLFGQDGFERMAVRVAGLEQAIGIHDLRQFTPR